MPTASSRSPRPRVIAFTLRAVAASTLLLVVLAMLAGCGSSPSTGTAADPAVAVPASATLYAGATVRPSGSQKTAALAAARALTHQANPYLRLLEALQTPGAPALDYKRDVAPWLGPHAGIFLSSSGSSSALLALVQQGLLGGSSTTSAFPFGTGGAQGAIVLDTTDAAKASSFLDAQASHAGAHTTAYRGVSYKATAAGVAFGLVHRFAVIGSEAGMHSVIDTALGGAALAHAGGYAKLLAVAPAGALAHIYANAQSPAVAGSTRESSGLTQLLVGARQANISLVPSAGSIALDADTLSPGTAGTPGGLLSSAAGGAQALAELPAESWLAVGLGDVGTTLAQDVQGLGAIASLGGALGGSSAEGSSTATLNVKGLLEGLLTPLRELGANTAQARRDFTSWMGSAGVFASGGSLLELKAAVVIASKNPALSRSAVAKLAAQLRKAGGSIQNVSIPGTEAAVAARLSGLPVMLYVADGRASNGQSKFVLGLGEASVTAALNPAGTLAGTAPVSAATAALGEGIQPNLTVDFPTVIGLLEGVGLTEDPSISKVVPYLRSVTTLAGGGHSLGGGVERVRLVLGLRPAAG